MYVCVCVWLCVLPIVALVGMGSIVTPHAQRERGKVIGRGVHYNMSVDEKKNLNRTLEIDSPFQTLTVGLLVEFID